MLITDDLPDGVMSSTERGRIYVSRPLLKRPMREIAEQMGRRIIDLMELWSPDGAVDALLPLLLNQHEDLKQRVDLGEEVAA